MELEKALAPVLAAEEGKGISKRQIKKLRHKKLNSSDRKAKKLKSQRETRNTNRIQAEAPVYSIANGYRMVKPYVYEFRTYAKARWFDRELLEIFTREFGANSPEYYKFAIASGRISVNHKIVPPDIIIKNGDLIIHTAHRHEPPVSDEEVLVVYEDDNLIVVSKPPSMPTHPCGAYRHNSLHSIVQASRPDLPQLNIVHRLDRLTSGVVLLAKNAAKARALSSLIADRQASKTYLARVRGKFPDISIAEVQDKLVIQAKEKCSACIITYPEHKAALISCPLRCLCARDGVWEYHPDGKPSETFVQLIRIDKDTSLMKCKPITGRTHQIRLHLQLIGFPIANDPCYGGEIHFGESVERIQKIAAARLRKADLAPTEPVDFSTPQQENECEKKFMERTCTWCNTSEAEAFSETQLHCSKIWLHALEYKLDGKTYKVPEPDWARPSSEHLFQDGQK